MTTEAQFSLTRVTSPSEEQSVFTGEIVLAEDRAAEDRAKADYYAPHIRRGWNKSVEGMLEAASWCAEAKKALTTEELKALQSRLPFDPSTFSKLAKIGRDDRLRDPQVKDLLPSKFSLVYEMSKLGDGDFQRLIDEGKVTPGLKRADLKGLLPPSCWSGGGKRRQAAGGTEGGRTVLPPLSIEALLSVPSEALADWVRPVLRVLAERGDQGLLRGDGDHPPSTDRPVGDDDDEGEARQGAAPARPQGPSGPEVESHAVQGGDKTIHGSVGGVLMRAG
jgi:hypothetical protein